MLSITRYRNTRYWALWEGGQLLVVTVYKKGAVTLMRRLQHARRERVDTSCGTSGHVPDVPHSYT